jgi:pimeloyl-ACP methyl ester carboxylesterase
MTARNITRRSMIGTGTGAVGVGLVAMTSGEVVSEARAQSASKTFVLIHGGWVGGWYWRRVADLLEKKGHKVFSPTLTGLGERSHLLSKEVDLDTHILDIVNVIKWENLNDICLVAHSYGGWPGSGALEQIGSNVSSIVWVDAYKPENAQKPVDFTAFSKNVLAAVEKGEVGIPAFKAGPVIVNENDSAWFNSKTTAQPIGTYLQPIKLSGALGRVAKKTYIRAPRFPNPAFDKALAECKADKAWNTIENATSGHTVMIDAPEWLADVLLQAS